MKLGKRKKDSKIWTPNLLFTNPVLSSPLQQHFFSNPPHIRL